jgi:uncharacterized protein Usg
MTQGQAPKSISTLAWRLLTACFNGKILKDGAEIHRQLSNRAHNSALGGRRINQGNAMRDNSEMDLMLRGYGLTTAKILYHYPDHPHLLQSFVWQDYDIAPKFPVLIRFIEFWKTKLDGPLHSVTYTHQTLIAPNEWRKVDGEFVLH